MLKVTWGVLILCAASGCSSSVGGAPPVGSTHTGTTWSVAFPGTPLDMSAGTDASVVVRLAAAPWLVRHDASGRASALSLEAGLDWASGLLVASDSSLFVAGTAASPDVALGSTLRVDHLSASGALLTSRQWQLPKPPDAPSAADNTTTFGGMTRGPRGEAYVLANATFGRAVVRLTPEGDIGTVTTVPIVLDEQDNYRDVTDPARLALASDGSYLLQGGSRALWLQRGDDAAQANEAWWLELAAASSGAVFAGGVAPAAGGGWFAAVGSGASDAQGHGYYHRGVVRLSTDGRRLWGAGDYFEPGAPEDPAALRHVSLGLLEDSVLLAVAQTSDNPLHADDITLSAELPHASLVRYTLKGDVARAFALGSIHDVAAISSNAAVVLSTSDSLPGQYTLERVDFEPLDLAPAARDERCSVSADCQSGACCASATGLFPVTCTDNAQCALGDYCNEDAQCDGSCLISPRAAGQGFCASACSTSSACPKNAACVDEHCYPRCSSAQDCPYRGTLCSDTADSDSISVSVCFADTRLF